MTVDPSLHDYQSVSERLKIAPSTLRRKISTWNEKCKEKSDRIEPDYKLEMPGVTKHYFNADTIERIKLVLAALGTRKRGRPKKEKPC